MPNSLSVRTLMKYLRFGSYTSRNVQVGIVLRAFPNSRSCALSIAPP